MKMWAWGVSFQSMRVLAKAEVSRAEEGRLASVVGNGKPSNGSQRSKEKGSKTLLRRPPKKLGIRDMIVVELGLVKVVELGMFCYFLDVTATGCVSGDLNRKQKKTGVVSWVLFVISISFYHFLHGFGTTLQILSIMEAPIRNFIGP